MKQTRVDFPDFKKEQLRLEDGLKKLPKWAGNATLNFYKDSWRRQGFIDRSFLRWAKRKGNESKKARGVLVKSGALRRSLRMSVSGTVISIHTDMPYAQGHNEGAKITQTVTPRQRRFFWAMHYKAKKTKRDKEAGMWKSMALATTININLPKRQFMDIPGGKLSYFMEQRLALHIESLIRNALP